jgi:hypothetical protein
VEKELEMAGRKEHGSRRPAQKERKESRAAMSRRENGKMKEKEAEGKKFCKLFMAPESREQLVRVFESLVNLSVMLCLYPCFSPVSIRFRSFKHEYSDLDRVLIHPVSESRPLLESLSMGRKTPCHFLGNYL